MTPPRLMATLRRWTGLSSLLVPLVVLGVVKFGVARLPAELLLAVKLYPALVNFTFSWTFGHSLYKPPSMVERIARLREPELPPRAVAYTRTVTQVWCGFFALNGGAALASALFASEGFWALYNGAIAYVLIASLYGGEWCVRQRFKKRLEHDEQGKAL